MSQVDTMANLTNPTRDIRPVPGPTNRLADVLREHQLTPRGVVHVGGHYAQELETYLACGFQQILYVEANPVVFDRLQEHLDFWRNWIATLHAGYQFQKLPVLSAINCAANDRNGHVALHVTEHDPQSSILFPIDEHIRSRGWVEVRCLTVDNLIEEMGADVSHFNLLSMDAQGAEKKVLEGATRLLPHLDLILTEVNYQQRYEGGVAADELDSYIGSRGFRRILATEPLSYYPVGDSLYLRQTSATPHAKKNP